MKIQLFTKQTATFAGYTVLLAVFAGAGYLLGSGALTVPDADDRAKITPSLTPTPTATLTVVEPIGLTGAPIPTGQVWKTFTSKRWSFAYPSDAVITADERYKSNTCKEDTLNCGKLVFTYKGLSFTHMPCTECGPENIAWTFDGPAVMIYGDFTDGIVRTLVPYALSDGKRTEIIAYMSIHTGQIYGAGIKMYVEPGKAGEYYNIADRVAVSLFNQGKYVETLPTPRFYPIAREAGYESVAYDVLDSAGKVVKSFDVEGIYAKLNGTGRLLALSPSMYYDLEEKELIGNESMINIFEGKDLSNVDIDLSGWISNTEFLVWVCGFATECEDKMAPGYVVNVETGKVTVLDQKGIDTMSDQVHKFKYTIPAP